MCSAQEGVRVIRTPFRLPQANAVAERFVRTVQGECLNHILIFGERHLERVLREHIGRYNRERPHWGPSLDFPEPKPMPNRAAGNTNRVATLRGLINEYH